MNFLVTSPTAWAVGTAMGGEGKLTWTYLGAALAFSGSAPAGQEALVLAVGAVLMPFTSAAFYELSSQMRWARSRQVTGAVTPVADESGSLAGATLSVRGAW